MPRRKVPYRVGTWFAVPLRDGRYAAGRLARTDPRGILLGYFFGPARADPPACAEVTANRAEDAIWVQRFGHLGLLHGTWPILCSDEVEDRSAWPIPEFAHKDSLIPDRWVARRYDENTLAYIGERR